jgi:predicted transcriptional regulator
LDLLYSLHNVWIEQILSGIKPIEFRSRLPKDIKQGTKIYLYETSKNNGRKMVVGECEVDYIINILSKDGKWPICGCYPFLEFYFENIKKNKDIANKYRELKTEFEYKLDDYRYGFISKYIFSDEELTSLRETGKLIDIWSFTNVEELNNHFKNLEKGEQCERECDEWLTKIGLYNEYGETYYKYGIVLKNIKSYNTPKPISDFFDKNNNKIKKAPQSWMYTTGCK